MRLVFKKDEESQISVAQKTDSDEIEFDYINLIKDLINGIPLEAPEIQDGFTEAEKTSINRMVNHINEKVLVDDDEDDELDDGIFS